MRDLSRLTKSRSGSERIRRDGLSFSADTRGVAAVEFAMLAVPFFGLLAALLESGLTYFYNSQLQIATVTASRVLVSHTAAAGLNNQGFIDQYVCTWKRSNGVVRPGTLPKLFDCDKVIVNISDADMWNNANTGNDFFDADVSDAQIALPATGRIAVLRIAYPLPAYLNILVGGAGVTSVHSGQIQKNGVWVQMLVGINAFRVEP